MAILLGSASAQITLDISSFMANARTAESAMDQLAAAGTNSQPTFFDKLKGSALGLGTALIVPMGLGIQAAIDLEQAIANVNAALGGVDASVLDDLAAGFQELGTASQFSATEVAAVGEGLAKAGFDPSELLNATEAVILLSQATGDGLAPAMDSVVAAMSIWSEETVGLENALTDATQVADIMTIAANNSTASITDINAGMRSLGPVAASMGVGFDEAAAAIALFTNYGLKGADAGISLARGLQNLADPTSEAAALMGELGIAAFDLEGNFIGFPALFAQLQTAMGDMTDQQQLMALSTIFGAEAMDVMGLAILNGAEPLEALIALMGESGAAAEQSAIRMDTLGAQFDTLKEGITTFLGSLVSGLIPGMRLIVDFANTVVDAMMRIPQPIKTVIGAIAGLLALFASINIGIGLFGALSGAMGALGIGAGAAGLALAPVLGIILGITAALGALYLAWRTNFLGMRTRFASFVNGIKRFGKSFLDTFRNLTTATYQWGDTVEDIVPTMDKFPAFFIALGNAIGTIGGGLPILGDLGRAIVDFGFDLDHLFGVFQQLRGEGFSPFIAALTAVTSAFPALIPIVNAVTPVVDALTDAFQRFSDGDFSGAISSLGDALSAAVSGIAAAIGALNIGEVIVSIASWGFTTLMDLGASLIEWVRTTALPAAGTAAGTIWDVVVNIGSWAQGIVSDIWPYIAMWAEEAIAFATGTAATLWDVAVDVGSWALGKAVSIGSYISLWAQEAWNIVSGTATPISGVLIDITSWAAGQIASVSDWLVEQIGLQDFTGAGDATRNKFLSALSLSFSAGAAAGGGGGIFDIGATILGWFNRQIDAMQTEGLGERLGSKIGSSLAAAFAGGAVFGPVASAFGAGFITAVEGEIDRSGFNDQFWAAFGNLGEISGDVFEGIAEGFLNSFTEAIAPEGKIDIGGVTVDLTIDFEGTLAEAFKTAFLESVMPTSTLDIGTLAIEVSDYDFGAGAQEAFRNAFINAVIPGGSLALDLLGIDIDFGGGDDSEASAGMDWGNFGESLGWLSSGILPKAITDYFNEQFPEYLRQAAAGMETLRLKLLDTDAAVGTVGPKFPEMATSITTGIQVATSAVESGMAQIIATMANGAATASTAAGTLFATVGTSIQTAMTAATSAAQAGINGIIAALANGGATATTALTATLAPIPAMVAAVGARSAAAAQVAGIQIATGFGQGAARTPALVAAALAAVPGIISSIGGRAAAAAFAVGANIGNAMAAGMRSALGQIQAAASAMVAAAQTALMAAAMISSPSRLFYGLGEYVGEGFELGIRSMIPAASMAAADLVTAPYVTPGQYVGSASAGGAYAGGGATYVIDARTIVQGDVTHENDLTARILTKGWEAERAEAIRHRVASGVTP